MIRVIYKLFIIVFISFFYCSYNNVCCCRQSTTSTIKKGIQSVQDGNNQKISKNNVFDSLNIKGNNIKTTIENNDIKANLDFNTNYNKENAGKEIFKIDNLELLNNKFNDKSNNKSKDDKTKNDSISYKITDILADPKSGIQNNIIESTINNFVTKDLPTFDINNPFDKNNVNIINNFPHISSGNKDTTYKPDKQTNNQSNCEPNEPILVGLKNNEGTCYINSVLQCLSQIKYLTDYFLDENNKSNIYYNNVSNKNPNAVRLSVGYNEVVRCLWNKNFSKKSISPLLFLNNLFAMNSLFIRGKAGDAKDLIIYILQQLHDELKKPGFAINNDSVNQYNQISAYSAFLNDFLADGKSIISNLFFGVNQTASKCLNCSHNYNSKGLDSPLCYNYNSFNLLIFGLGEVINTVNSSQSNKNNVVDIYDCFDYNQKPIFFKGDDGNFCNLCKQHCNSVNTTKIYNSPKILVIYLNRGKAKEFNVKVNFHETIDLSNYVEMNKSEQIYDLCGVVTHIGQSGQSAHYVASCKSSFDNKWYRFDDSYISEIQNFKKEVIDFESPYLLFYEKIIH